MYVPRHNEETDLSVLRSLIRAHPLGSWATQGDGELIVNHVPFLLDPSRGEYGTLMGHVARANGVWQSFSKTVASVVVFQGAEAYITPSWYPSKHAHGKAVPTWNYVVVHAHGLPVVIEEKAWLVKHLNELTETHEADQALPWRVSDAPSEFTERMIEHIVGIEIPIAKLVGKWKVSQNRSDPDKLGVVAGLLAKDDARSREMAALVEERVSSRAAPLTHAQTDLQAAVAALDAAWQAPDAGERERLLARALAPGAELVGPEPVGRRVGVPAISALIGGFAGRWPGARVVVTTGIDAHHGWARYGWAIRDAAGATLLDGIDVAQAGPDGRLSRVVMFYGAAPPAGTAS